MGRSLARRQRQKGAGLCSQCNDLPVPGRSRCRKHLDKANAMARRRNAARKAHGYCLRCPNRAKEGHVLCQVCLDKPKKRDTEKRSEKLKLRQASGRCRWCPNPPVPGRTLCDAHLKAKRVRERSYRAKRKAKGLCLRCSRTARPVGVLCQ